jgi:Protein of unknown function (DUF2971)
MANQISAEELEFARIFHPYAHERSQRVIAEKTRFVHYTTAEAAMKILQSREVWMRKSSCMSDFLEVQYGLQRLIEAYQKSNASKRFRTALDSVFKGISEEAAQLFDGWRPHFEIDTYFTCVSEHEDAEDLFGRLSMWRAYSETTGIALVLKNSVFINPADGFGAYASPVAYLDASQFEKEFDRVAENVCNSLDLIRSRTREDIKARIFNMLRLTSVSTKHPGFREEREWRIVYCPTLEKSAYLKEDIQVVKGIPQPVYKIPLQNIEQVGLVAAIPDLLDRIIIGPSQYPFALAEAFVRLLKDAGVQDAENRICISDIPIRR